ncbi:MAG: cupin domain-containing protein [Melioribacteraceae bacterium]|jgi:quercetin dioxygenase-like cupin family protein
MSEIKADLLIKQVDFQNSSIVSKQIIKNKNGNVTLFAFDKGESLTEHTSPFQALVFIAEGEMEIKIGGNPHNIKAGEIILLPQNIPHSLVANEKTKMLLTMIKEN